MRNSNYHFSVATVILATCVLLGQSAYSQDLNTATEGKQIETCKCFVDCYTGRPAVANIAVPTDFTDEIAIVTCFAEFPEIYVLGIVDIKAQCNALLGWNLDVNDPHAWEPPMFHNENQGTHEWTVSNLGSIFGLTIDDAGDFYVTATTSYNTDFFPTVHGPGTGGEIYKIDGQTGDISLFTGGALPNSGQGLGNITYDGIHDQFFVSNMDDGLIYRIAGDGSFIGVLRYDHGVDGRPNEGDTIIQDDNNLGFTQLGRRIWGLEMWNGGTSSDIECSRLYYSVWWEDFGRRNASETNEIWSVEIDFSTGDFRPVTAKREIKLPNISALSGGWSMPVSDISFKPDGRILLAEHGMGNDTTPKAHWSRLLQYNCHVVPYIEWNRDLDTQTGKDVFLVGKQEVSTAGGVDVGFGSWFPPILCGGRVWATADALHQPPPTDFWVYGLAGLPYYGGNTNDDNPFTCIYIDIDLEYTQHDKWEQGDVEIPCTPWRCCRTAGDADGGGDPNIGDAIFIVNYIFQNGDAPPCDDAADADGGGDINIGDATYIVKFIFQDGKIPVCGTTGT